MTTTLALLGGRDRIVTPEGTPTLPFQNDWQKLAEEVERLGEPGTDITSVRSFGAVGDGVADDSAAFQAGIMALLLNETITNFGAGTLYVPKGKYRIVTGFTLDIADRAARSLHIVGDGDGATTLQFENNSGVMFNFNQYQIVRFEDLRAEWTGTGVNTAKFFHGASDYGFGSSGGRNLQINRCTVNDFDIIIDLGGEVDNDSTFVSNSTLIARAAVYKSRSTQSVNNTFIATGFYATGAVFDIKGAGHTQIIGCHGTTPGAMFLLNGFPDINKVASPNIFLIDGLRVETALLSGQTESRTSLIKLGADWQDAHYSFNFKNTSLIKTITWDVAYPQIEVTPTMRVLFEGGRIYADAIIKTYPAIRAATNSLVMPVHRQHKGLMFRDMDEAPLPTQVTRGEVGVSGAHPSVTYRNVSNRTNLCFGYTWTGGTLYVPMTMWEPEQENVLTGTGLGAADRQLLCVNATTTHGVSFYGSKQELRELSINFLLKQGTDITFTIHATAAGAAAGTGILETITFAVGDNGYVTQSKYASTTLGKIFTEGVFVRVVNASAGTDSYGWITCKTRCVS